jgi:hypothetical protein
MVVSGGGVNEAQSPGGQQWPYNATRTENARAAQLGEDVFTPSVSKERRFSSIAALSFPRIQATDIRDRVAPLAKRFTAHRRICSYSRTNQAASYLPGARSEDEFRSA